MNQISQADISHTERDHALLSASGTEIWWNCPGSITFRRRYNLHGTTSKWAAEGTAAHEVCNLCLETNADAIEMIGRTFNDFVVDEGMAEAVQVYLDECRKYMGPGWVWFVERKFTLAPLNPPDPMFGTSDFTAYHVATKRLVVVDFKYGKGVSVEIRNNKQLRYYALGMLYALPPDVVIEDIDMVIVQPRIMRGDGIKKDHSTQWDLLTWSAELMERAAYALSGVEEFKAGSHCRFCPVSGRCPEQAAVALASAQHEFDLDPDQYVVFDNDTELLDIINKPPSQHVALPPVVVAPVGATIPSDTLRPIDVRILSPEQMARFLVQVEILEDWIPSLRQAAHDMIESGTEIPGFKLVQKRPTNRWKDEATNGPEIIAKLRISEADVWQPRKMVTPAQLRDHLAKRLAASRKLTKKDATEFVWNLLQPFISAPSSGPTLVSADDPRPAIARRVDDFDCLPVPD